MYGRGKPPISLFDVPYGGVSEGIDDFSLFVVDTFNDQYRIELSTPIANPFARKRRKLLSNLGTRCDYDNVCR